MITRHQTGQKISLAELTTENLRTGQVSLPSFEGLKQQVENKGWHDNQNVFDHSLKCVDELEQLLVSTELPGDIRPKLHSHLKERVGRYSRGELLRVGVLLHDIGKLVTLKKSANGSTACPGHALVGEWLARPLLDSIEVDMTEAAVILQLIAEHMIVSELFETAIANHTPNREVVQLLQENRPSLAIELLLVAYADWLGCDITLAVEDERNQRVARAQEALTLLLT